MEATAMPPQAMNFNGRISYGKSPTAHSTGRVCRMPNDTSSDQKEFLTALYKLFSQIKNEKRDSYYCDLTKFLYSSIPLPNRQIPGSEYAKQLLSGLIDRNYTLPGDEVRFVNNNTLALGNYFNKLRQFPGQPITFVSLGCGPYQSIELKDIPLVRALGATKYVAVDLNKDYARSAADIVKHSVGISTSFLARDFTNQVPVPKCEKNSLIVLSLLGDTLGQHPVTDDKGSPLASDGVPLADLLQNFGKATNYNAILMATIDCGTSENAAIARYHGPIMMGMMKTLWSTAKEVMHSEPFDPTVFKYRADFDHKASAVTFNYTVSNDTTAHAMGEDFLIPRGTNIIIGCSQKGSGEKFIPTFKQNGWEQALPVPDLVYDSTVRLIVTRGKNLAAPTMAA